MTPAFYTALRKSGALLVLAACGVAPQPTKVSLDSPDLPLTAATDAERDRFAEGDGAFDLQFRAADGLGPVYIRASCAGCHQAGGRGPGTVTKFVQVDGNGVAVVGQPKLAFGHTARPQVVGSATPLEAPSGADILTTQRNGVAVFGRGYLEAVADSEVERVEAAQRDGVDGVTGRINRVTFASKANPGQRVHNFTQGTTNLIGRFGLKARIATLDDFTADAAQGDMGLTSPLRDTELPNPDGATDDAKPGVDLTLDFVNLVADYMRLSEVPRRAPATDAARALFASTGCATCHVPTLRTRADYPITALANVDAPIFSDLLLHDMGPAFSDGLSDGDARPSEWKTAPLIGLRHLKHLLHDGRAASVEDAITLHGGEGSEAAVSVARFNALSSADRTTLLSFVESL